MTAKPGLARAIPMSIIGFVVAALLVTGIRALQSMDPVWDTGVVLVVASLVVAFAFVWGMGGLDPRMNEHPHQPEGGLETALIVGDAVEAHHEEETPPPFAILSSIIWQVSTYTLIIGLFLFAFAMLPTGLTLRTVNQAEADTANFETLTTFDLPLGLGSFEGSQLAVFMGFVGFTLLSLFAFGGGIGLLIYTLSRQITEARASTPTPAQLTPPLPARWFGRVAGNAARGLRRGLPRFFGMK
jgi:hypothetical protein